MRHARRYDADDEFLLDDADYVGYLVSILPTMAKAIEVTRCYRYAAIAYSSHYTFTRSGFTAGADGATGRGCAARIELTTAADIQRKYCHVERYHY